MSNPKIGTMRYMTTALAIGAAGLLAATVTGAGIASAKGQDSRHADIAVCEGLSPHIIDVPYMGDLHVSQDAANPGIVDVSVAPALDLWGYDSHPTITWTNLATGVSGVLAGQSSTVGLANSTSASYEDVPTGSGLVRFDLSVANVGTFPLPPITCNGTFDVY